jgi:NADH dehydrogenase FAD-containing subunit
MGWNYRILKHDEIDYYDVREVYYDDDGNVKFVSETPMYAAGNSPEDVLEDLKLMQKAFQKEVIVKSDLSFGDKLKVNP